MIGQELQVILIKLKLQRVLLQNLQGYKKTERQLERVEEGQSVRDSWITSPPSHETGKNVSSPSEGKGQ